MTEKIQRLIEESDLSKLKSVKILCYLEIIKEIDGLNSELRKISEFPNIDNSGIGLTSPIGPIRPITDSLNLEVRQSAILEKIKQLSQSGGECGLKELMAAFPDVSDRTLRYDLQKLIFQGLIVKVGNRGPNTNYRSPRET